VAIVDSLVQRNPTMNIDLFLPQAEFLRRLTGWFPHAVIDWERGDRIVRGEIAQLEELDAHQVVLDNHRGMLGHTAYITIREEAEGPKFGFFLRSRPTMVDIDFEQPEDRAATRPLLEALATALDWDILTEDVEEEEEDLEEED
jgi:hypothetical protein